MLGAILEEPPFVDDTSSLGARAGGGANVLQRHEELVLLVRLLLYLCS